MELPAALDVRMGVAVDGKQTWVAVVARKLWLLHSLHVQHEDVVLVAAAAEGQEGSHVGADAREGL